MNASISRAIAVTTTLGCLPPLISRRYRLQSLNCAFHAIALIGFGSESTRF
jgi:hypothetical protein